MHLYRAEVEGIYDPIEKSLESNQKAVEYFTVKY